MAKRSGAASLAGLAALGALGYQLLKNKKGDTTPGAPVEDRVGKPVERQSDSGEYDPIASGDWSYGEPGMVAKEPGWESKAAPPKVVNQSRSVKPVIRGSDLPSVSNDSQAMPAPKGGSGGGRGPAFGEREAYEATRYKPRYTPPGQAPKISAGARYPMTSLTREDVLRSTEPEYSIRMKKGGAVKKMASGGVTRSSASKRADGIAQKGKTRGTMVMCGGGRTKK